ncbi:MAG TPA: DinB family protein [Candidatus Dormibacteraeota bacterium]
MPTESETFGAAQVEDFLDELLLVERDALVARLEAAGRRLAELAGRIPESAAADGSGWGAKQVLAHIAALSKLYGMMTYRIGKGAMTEFELLPMVHQRDAAGEALAQMPVPDLVAMIQADHARTIAYVREASAADLRRRCALDVGAGMTAGEVLRLPLVAHVEQHLGQLEAALG